MTRKSGRPRAILAALICSYLLAISMGCEGPSNEAGEYMIWPQAARLGDSVAVLVATETDVNWRWQHPYTFWKNEDVTIKLTDALSVSATVTPSAIIEVPTALGSKMRGPNLQSWTGVVAIFELPGSWNSDSQWTGALTVEAKLGPGVFTFLTNSLLVTGGGGSATQFGTSGPIEAFQLKPMVRLRPNWDPTNNGGFDPSWNIGALEFTLIYTLPAGGGWSVSNPQPLPNGDAPTALVMAGPEETDATTKRWKITLLKPEGFSIPATLAGCSGGFCFSGRWPLIDVIFAKNSGTRPDGQPVFELSDFGIEDMKVFDPDGNLLNAASNPSLGYFWPFPVNNLSESGV